MQPSEQAQAIEPTQAVEPGPVGAGLVTTGPTSEPVAAAATRLESLTGRPLAEHPDVYQQIHADLQRALADIDDV